MLAKVSIKSVVRNLSFVLIGMAITAGLLISRMPSGAPAAQAAGGSLPLTFQSEGPNNPQTATWIFCTPVAVATFDNRVHVECASAVGNIRFFAAPNSNPAHAARVLSTLTAAQMAGRTLSILYDPDDTSGTEFGCLDTDCRRIIAVGFGQ